MKTKGNALESAALKANTLRKVNREMVDWESLFDKTVFGSRILLNRRQRRKQRGKNFN
jgi:hypothetical protein